MMKCPLVTIIALALMTFSMNAKDKYPYQNAGLPVEQRVEDLLSRMTLEEKAGQIVCLMGWDSYQISGKKVTVSDKFRQEVDSLHVGMYWAVFRADPWTRKTIANGLNPALAAQAANAMQRYAIEKTRLGIPIFLAEEAPHGHMAIGATVFPTGLGMAATWSRDMMQQAGEIIGKEVRSHQLRAGSGFGPRASLVACRGDTGRGSVPEWRNGRIDDTWPGWRRLESTLLGHRHAETFYRLRRQ